MQPVVRELQLLPHSGQHIHKRYAGRLSEPHFCPVSRNTDRCDTVLLQQHSGFPDTVLKSAGKVQWLPAVPPGLPLYKALFRKVGWLSAGNMRL
jgi:hypothetical protein